MINDFYLRAADLPADTRSLVTEWIEAHPRRLQWAVRRTRQYFGYLDHCNDLTRLAALLGDEQDELYEFTVRFTHAECVVTDYTDSTEAGMAETLESITALCAEEAGLDYDAPTPEALEKFLQGIGGYKIAEENLYRFEAGVFNQACEEFYELLFTRRVCARSGNWELTICFYYPPEAQLEEYSDLVCADDPDSFVKEVLASEALQTVLTQYKPMRVRVHAEQV